MVAVSIQDLKERAEDLLRQVQETGEPVEIVDRGQAVAQLIPATTNITDQSSRRDQLDDDFDVEQWLTEFDELAREIGAAVPEGTTALDMINDVRREL